MDRSGLASSLAMWAKFQRHQPRTIILPNSGFCFLTIHFMGRYLRERERNAQNSDVLKVRVTAADSMQARDIRMYIGR